MTKICHDFSAFGSLQTCIQKQMGNAIFIIIDYGFQLNVQGVKYKIILSMTNLQWSRCWGQYK